MVREDTIIAYKEKKRAILNERTLKDMPVMHTIIEYALSVEATKRSAIATLFNQIFQIMRKLF